MPSSEDACYVCAGDRSTSRNPIIFCDGKGCNMPVHKVCYNVEEIPEDDWYCQRCENRKRKKATNIVCCPMQTGAVKKTTVTGEYMHVVCAMWNTVINKDVEPYEVDKALLDTETCYICNIKKGLTIKCEHPDCMSRFHATCGINSSLITPASAIPIDFVPKCNPHQTYWYPLKKITRRRRLRRNDSDDDEEDSEGGSDESEEEEDDEEHNGVNDSEDDERQSKKKNSLMINRSKGKVPITPMKRRASPQSLFPEDQQSSDDDMGTSSSSKHKLNTFGTKPMGITSAIATSAFVSPSATTTPSYKDRLEAKRKKSALEGRVTQDDSRRMLTTTPPLPHSAMGLLLSSASVTPKQKLPNRAHLTTNNNNAINPSLSNNNIGNGFRPINTPPGITKRYNGPGMIKDIDEIQNEIKAQRWNNGAGNTALYHPQPTTPHTTTTPFFENEIARNNNHSGPGQRKPSDSWRPTNGGENEEFARVREENRKLVEFKRAVSEIFCALNVPVPAGIQPDVDHVENYVAQLQILLRRVGPIRDNERVQIQECVKGLTHNQ